MSIKRNQNSIGKEVRTIKIFGVDVSAKYLAFKLNGIEYFVGFRISKNKGVYDVFVLESNKKTDARITKAYPPLKQVVKELWQVHFRYWIKKSIRKFLRSHNR